MSLAKLFKAPIKLFRKDVITFVIIRRYDLGVLEKRLRYVAVKSSASINVLRRKIWYLLDLPDYCDEIIVLKSTDDVPIPLTELRKGNDPEHPYFLEVWPPGKHPYTSTTRTNLLTIANGDIRSSVTTTDLVLETERKHAEHLECNVDSQSTIYHTSLRKQRVPEPQYMNNENFEYKKSEASSKISNASFFQLNRRKSRDNFINVLLKIQNDLSTLNYKLSNLETRIPV